jgi:hypothetical protein
LIRQKIRKRKVVLSLIVAAIFMLSAASTLATNVSVDSSTIEKDNAGDIDTIPTTIPVPETEKPQVYMGQTGAKLTAQNTQPIGMGDDGCWPVAIEEITVGGHTLPAVISTGTYEVCINVTRPDYCEDSGPYELTGPDDINQEFPGPCVLQPIRSWDKCNPDYVYIKIRNYGMCPGGLPYAIGFVGIMIDDECDCSFDRYFHASAPATQLSDMGGPIAGSRVWWGGANQNQVTVRIPREFWADCCDELCYAWEVWCPTGACGNVYDAAGCGIKIEDPCDCDMYDAEVKKFMEIYKWHDPITEDDITDEIYCEDFEDPCVVHDNFDAVDANADGDTWILTDKRSHSPDHSFHNTQHDEYMPNAEDYLIMDMGDPGLGPGLDVSGYDELKVEFWHWMQGDFVDPTILDYGWVEYSFTGAFAGEEVFAGGLYYDNDWELVTFTIDVDPLDPSDDALYLRWGFIADAGFCYEGWYIDDLCIYGTTFGSVISGYWEFIHDSHSWPQIIEGPYEWYCFPDLWTVTEEGTYKVCAWLQTLDECHYPEHKFGHIDAYCEEIEIGDILELELDCPAIVTPPSPAFEGDDVAVSTQVCNIGTLDATDVQVQMTVNRGTMDTVFSDDVESGPYTDDDIFNLIESYTGYEYWSIVSTSPNHAWYWGNPDGKSYPPDVGYDGSFPPFGYTNAPMGVGPRTYAAADKALNPMLKFDAKWAFDVGGDGSDFFGLGIHDVSMDAFVRYGYNAGMATPTQTDFKGGEQLTMTSVEFDYTGLLNALTGWGDGDGDWQLAFGVYTRPTSAGVSTDPNFAGLLCDNFQIIQLVKLPGDIFVETKNIPFIPKPSSITCEPVDFLWPNAGVGRYVITTEIISPVDVDPGNNKCTQPYDVINIICDIDDCGTVTFVDHTGGPGHWMVEGCCGGYLWSGDPATTAYGNNWNDCLYLLDADGDRTFDCSAFTTTLQVEFDAAWMCEAADMWFVEVSVDDGGAWWPCGIGGFSNPSWPNFDSYIVDCVLPLSGVGLAPTATTQFRFRFASNDSLVNRGVYLDNIAVKMNPYIFGPDDCTTMDNFETEAISYGNWWRTPHQEGFAFSYYNLPGILPSQTFGNYDPLAWTTLRPWNAFYPDNLDNSLDWTLTLPHAFYGYIVTTPLWNVEPVDELYLQISDGGPFDTLDTFTGPGWWWAPYSQYDVTDYLNSDVTIRYNFKSDATTSAFLFGPYFEGMTFYGMEDTNAPVTTIELVGDIDPVYLYYTDGVAVYLTATDDVTGVKATYYELDGGPATEYVGPFMVEDDGTHQVCFWSEDFENNVETKKCSVEFKIDQTGPSVTITEPGDGLFFMGNKLLDLEGKSIHIFGGVQVSATVTVSGAPLKVVEFYMNDVLFAQDVTAPFGAFCTEKNQGSATFKVKAIDVLDASSEATKSVDTYIKIF